MYILTPTEAAERLRQSPLTAVMAARNITPPEFVNERKETTDVRNNEPAD